MIKIQTLITTITTAISRLWLVVSFVILVIVAVIHGLVRSLFRTRLFKLLPKDVAQTLVSPIEALYQTTLWVFDRKQGTIGRAYLIEMSLKVMRVKKTRSIITMGGMALGIALIVFLVSIGYGLQSVVIDRVVRLNEMRQADVVPGLTPELALNDQAIARIEQIPNVEASYPVIAAVGRVEYQDSVADIALYGVTTQYLAESAVAPVRGRMFDNNQLAQVVDSGGDRDVDGSDDSEASQVLGANVLGVSDLSTSTGAIDIIQTKEAGDESQTELVLGRYGQRLHSAVVEAPLDQWLRVRSGPSVNEPIIGYARLFEPEMMTRVYGSEYSSGPVNSGLVALDRSGEYLGWWLHGVFELWERSEDCQVIENAAVDNANTDDASADADRDQGDFETSQTICTPHYSPQLNDDGSKVILEGYTAQLQLSVLPDSRQLSNFTPVEPTSGAVLGETDETEEATNETEESTGETEKATGETASEITPARIVGDGSLELVKLDVDQEASVRTRRSLPVAGDPAREVVVNRALLDLIGVRENEALGLELELQMVVLGELLEDDDQTVESVPTKYTVVGVTPEVDTPVAYVPFIDMRSLGVNRYSQLRVVTGSTEVLAPVRATIESLGYATTSVADTVAQIDRLFASLRLLLGILGLVALSVAALGMFNTLTVSLLERTHEVGLLKALGMSSDEVRELFLTESMIMGFFGGVLGLVIGIFGGKLLGILLSSISLSRGGVGEIAISQTPLSFILVILTISLLIGVLTGWYPARRATKISALDALRYE